MLLKSLTCWTKKPIHFVLDVLLFLWKKLSPLFLGRCCRFEFYSEPSCSQYAVTSIKQDGLLHGSLKALKRISQCHSLK